MTRDRTAARGTCKTCAHPERPRIELMLANGVSAPKVSAQFGLTRHAVWRHFNDHVTEERKAKLAVGSSIPEADLAALKKNESDSLLANLIHERTRLQRLSDRAETVGNLQDATRASKGVIDVLTVIAKVLGDLRVAGHEHYPEYFAVPGLVQDAPGHCGGATPASRRLARRDSRGSRT